MEVEGQWVLQLRKKNYFLNWRSIKLSVSFPPPSGALVLVKHHILKMEITKANLSFGSHVSKRFPYCGLLLSIEKKNRLPHVFYSIIAKKAVFRRQKQRYGRGGIS